jgi:type II secretory pathway component PulK
VNTRVKDERGVALLIVLTVVALLMITVMEFAYNVQLDHRRTRNAVDAMQARLLARSGLNLAEAFLIQDQEDKFDAFSEDWALALDEFCTGIPIEPTMKLRCGWRDESGKININMTRPKGPPRAEMGDAPARPDQVLTNALFHILHREDAYNEDTQKRLQAYWAADYENQTTNEEKKSAPDFGSLEDFAALFQIAPAKLNKLRRFLTAQSNRRVNRINVNTAPEEVLYAIFVGDFNEAGGEAVLQQILDERREAAYEDMGQVKAIVSSLDTSVRAAIENGILSVSSKCFRLEASALTNVDPTSQLEGEVGELIDAPPPVPTGIGQTLNELVCRTKKLNPNQGGGRSNTNQNQDQQFVWTLKRLDWQKEAGARLFREPLNDALDPDDETDEDSTGLTGEEDDEF